MTLSRDPIDHPSDDEAPRRGGLRRIVAALPALLAAGGIGVLELGIGQSDDVAALGKAAAPTVFDRPKPWSISMLAQASPPAQGLTPANRVASRVSRPWAPPNRLLAPLTGARKAG